MTLDNRFWTIISQMDKKPKQSTKGEEAHE